MASSLCVAGTVTSMNEWHVCLKYSYWSPLGTLKGSINVSSDEQGSHPDDFSVSVSSVSVLFCDADSRLFASHLGSVERHPWCHDVTTNHVVYTSAWQTSTYIAKVTHMKNERRFQGKRWGKFYHPVIMYNARPTFFSSVLLYKISYIFTSAVNNDF